MNIAFIPIDNRPVCYTLPQQICAIDSKINLFIPEKKFLGSLTKNADVEAIFEWLEKLSELDAIVMCLDTVAYGGLIPSRRCPDTFDEIRARVEKLKAILEKKKAKIYVFSSIMRISNNNVNEEEKEYWNKWGKKIFEYSFNSCKNGKMVQTDVPQEILDDYLATRKRNFEINKLFLQYQKQGLFETLVFSKDDCAEFGFNVKEAQELENLGGFVKTGADEIPLTLLARAVSKAAKQLGSEAARNLEASRSALRNCGRVANSGSEERNSYLRQQYEWQFRARSDFKTLCRHETDLDAKMPKCNLPNFHSIKIAPIFLAPEYKDLISNYEDVSIEKSVKGQIELAGCEVCEPDEADILLYVNNFEEHQGEIVMKVPTKPFSGTWQKPQKPYIIADVRYANGADNAFVEQVFETGLGENFLGYSAWNTSANSLGSLICGAVITKFAKQQERKSEKSETEHSPLVSRFLKLQLVRFLDDWAYQANIRQQLASPDEKLVKELMKPFEQKIFELLNIAPDEYNITYKFPWNRLFEVEVCISQN